jgi:hypothetical protein
MQVLLTIILIAAVGAAFVFVQQRLDRMRREVKAAWKLLEPDQTNEAAKTVYNKRVAAYNAMLEAFPANIVGPLVGFKPARPF